MAPEAMIRDAVFSPCRMWRYGLHRTWDASLPGVIFICLNPSTADETQDDPTVRRCIGFARDWGYGSLVVGNIFALRSTDPGVLSEHPDPVGPGNDRWLKQACRDRDRVIAAWGNGGHLQSRGGEVLGRLPEPFCLGMTKCGHPRHPLYLPARTQPVPCCVEVS